MEQHQKILALGISIMLFCIAFLFIVTRIRGPLLETPPIVYIILLFTGFAIILYGLVKWQIYREQGPVVKDERTQKIFDKSRSYTLYITIPFIIIIVGLYQALNIELNYGIVWIVIIQVAITQIIFKWYFNRKKNL